jgi:serine phosphatase RsbU (regulator of sigma subunit)
MYDLCTEIGYRSLNKFGEQLCGDRVDVVKQDEDSVVVVLADGLGSGVKANILSILTSKIISTMMAQSMSLEDCVSTIASTLPVCSVRGIAYSTFSIVRIVNAEEVEFIQYDNPQLILMRNGKSVTMQETIMNIGGKNIRRCKMPILDGDVFILMSDGAVHAGARNIMNYGWDRKHIVEFLEKKIR